MRALMASLTTSIALFVGGCANGPFDDVGAAQYNICCGANCCCASLGTGGAIGPGDLNPANPCEVCDPSMSQTAWTPVADCDAGSSSAVDAGPGPTDAGGGTDAGPPAGSDGGTPVGTDAGPGGTDAGSSSGTDAGSGGVDAGPGDDGGGCSASPTSPVAPFGLALLGAVGAALVARRRAR